MRKLLLVLFLCLLLMPDISRAANTANVKGRILTQDKEKAGGAAIKVEGTDRGAIAKLDGTFTIMGLPVGTIVLKVTYMQGEVTETVTLSAGETKDVGDIIVSNETVAKEIVITGNRAGEVNTNSTGTSFGLNAEKMNTTSRTNLGELVGSQAGVMNTGDGFSIRGSRSNETSLRLDGVEISNPLTGGFGSGGTAYFPMPSTLGLSEVQVVTGGFPAEYGEAMGGIVNQNFVFGNKDRYQGAFMWKSDFGPLFGSSKNSLGLEERDGVLRAYNNGDGHQLEAATNQQFDFFLSGPIPFTDGKAVFSVTSNFTYRDGNRSYGILDPLGSDISNRDHNEAVIKRIDLRSKITAIKNVDISLGATYGISYSENNDWNWSLSNNFAVGNDKNYIGSIANNFTQTPEYLAKQNAQNVRVMNFLARIQHNFENASFYQITLSYNQNDDDNSRRTSMDAPNFFTGYDLLKPQDLYIVSDKNNKKETIPDPNGDQKLDHYNKYTDMRKTADGYYEADFPTINPFTGYYEGNEGSNTHNPYGWYSTLFNKHSTNGIEFRKTSYYQAAGFYEIIFNDDKMDHDLKTGFEVRSYEVHRNFNSAPWNELSSFDVFTDLWGGNLYIPPSDPMGDPNRTKNLQIAREKGSQPFKPLRAGLYVQDQIRYKGIVFTPGLRLDYFDANAEYRTSTSKYYYIYERDYFAPTEAKFYVSPRMFVTYPLTVSSKIDLSYGLFLKTPDLQYLYDKFYTMNLTNGSVLGNPNMKPQRSSQYQVSYENWFTEEIKFNVTAYYKDIYNQLGAMYVPATPVPFYIYSTTEYGSSKGLEFNLSKVNTDNFEADLNYTLATNMGTSPGPASNINRPTDPYTDKMAFPLAEFYMNNDVRHTVNYHIGLIWGNNEGPEVWGIQPLENVNISFDGLFRSGYPYTRFKRSGEPVSEYNDVRQPSYWNLDVRFSKLFMLSDWFGTAVGRTSVEIFLVVNNVLNRRVPVQYYGITADPDDNGTGYYVKESQMFGTVLYKDANPAQANTYGVAQYDGYGDRMYNKQADINKDGMVTPEEQFQAYRTYLRDIGNMRRNYQTPRTAQIGVRINF